jgi:hypothetical protein
LLRLFGSPALGIPGSSPWLKQNCSLSGKREYFAVRNSRNFILPAQHKSAPLMHTLSLPYFIFLISLVKIIGRILKRGGEDLGSIGFYSKSIKM